MNIFVFDIEANGFLDVVTKVHCGCFKSLDGKTKKSFKPDEIPEMLRFMDTIDVIIGHNILSYDLPVLRKLYGYVFKGKKVDSLIMSRILKPKRLLPPHAQNKAAGPHSLYAWGVRVGVDKPDHDDWENFSEDMLHRCEADVEINHKVYFELLKEADGGKWKNAFLLSFKLFENLQEQEEYGWLADRPYMEQCIHQLDTWIRRIDSVITPKLPLRVEIEEQKIKGEYKYVSKPFLKSGEYAARTEEWILSIGLDPSTRPVVGPYSRISFRPTNLNSNAETKEYLLKEGWEPLEWNTNDEGEQTSPKLNKDDPFEGIDGKMGKLVAKRVQCRQRKSIVEGLIGIIRPDGRIAGSVANMAVTGRLTHRGIVNIPGAKSFFGKQMRKMFICKDGFVLVSTDSDACQIRMLAGRMNDEQYTETVINGDKDKGTDIHTVNMRAAELNTRDDAKTFFYGFLFGAGDAKTGKIVKGTAAHGKRLKEQFLKGLPALGDLMEKLKAEWKATAKRRFNPRFNNFEYYDGYITGLDGRPILVGSEHAILVYLLQSDEAIMMTAAYNMANSQLRKKYKYGVDFGTVCFYHDEFTFECREEIAEDVKRISEHAIAWAGRYFKIPCPHVGQGKIGKNWYEVH